MRLAEGVAAVKPLRGRELVVEEPPGEADRAPTCHRPSRYPVIASARRRATEGLPRRAAGSTDTHKEQLGSDLLEFLTSTNERAADESRHVHA
jgi:hypothetical protein